MPLQIAQSFADMAALRPEDVKLIPLPRGTYMVEVFETPADPEPTSKGYGLMFRVKLRIVAPIENFENPGELEAYIDEMGDPSGTIRTLGFYIPTKDNPESKSTKSLQAQHLEALNRVIKYFSTILALGSKPLEEYRAECRGARHLLTVTWEQDPEAPGEFREKLPELRDCAPLE